MSKQILRLVKEGDEKAFKLIFNSFYPRLYVFSLNYLKDSAVAEEIVGDVFVKLWEKRKEIDKIINLKSYLYMMVRNASIDHLKNKHIHKNVLFETVEHDSHTVMNEFVIEEEVHSLLFKALEALPKKCKRVFELSCIEGLKYKDIAEDLQISINTVKSQRTRAIKLLKLQLKDYSFLYALLGLF